MRRVINHEIFDYYCQNNYRLLNFPFRSGRLVPLLNKVCLDSGSVQGNTLKKVVFISPAEPERARVARFSASTREGEDEYRQ
jgi:hypothetical protein